MKFALLAAVSALEFELDLFHPSSFVQTMMKQPNWIKSAVASNDLKDVGKVTWSQCADDLGVFTFDESSTTYTPDPITKGKPVNLDMHGIVSSAIDVTDIHVQCDWNHAPVYNNDIPGDHKWDSSLEFKFSWDVPAYAPAGAYSVTITGMDASKKKDFCINAAFNL